VIHNTASLEHEDLIFGSSLLTLNKRPRDSTHIKPSSQSSNIHKIYLANVSVSVGESITLKCPFLSPQILSMMQKESHIKSIKKIDHNHRPLMQKIDIKTQIWSKEMQSYPKILSNNHDLLIMNHRFNIEKNLIDNKLIAQALAENIYNNNNKNNNQEIEGEEENEYYLLSKNYKEFNLRICPVRKSDSGWYSCTIVRKYSQNENIKLYIYLNVNSGLNDFLDKNNNDDEDYYDYYDHPETMSKMCSSSSNNLNVEPFREQGSSTPKLTPITTSISTYTTTITAKITSTTASKDLISKKKTTLSSNKLTDKQLLPTS
jgi:hypothetical protein